MSLELSKAEELLKAASICLEKGPYNPCASRCYYAIFWAAIAALDKLGVRRDRWPHGSLAAETGKHSVIKHSVIDRTLASRIDAIYHLRLDADYGRSNVGKKVTARALRNGTGFVERVKEAIN